MPGYHVGIVGAGPYGLTAAAHLRAAGVETKIFGDVMGFWAGSMPNGMLVRSEWAGSHLSDPARALTLDRYERERGTRLPTRIPLADFVDYGRWFQRQAVPDVDRRMVHSVETGPCGFHLRLEDGETVPVKRVVIATGLGAFVHRPQPFQSLPVSLVSHSSEECDLSRFAGRRVVVVGAGQSALESAALLHEGGALVEVVTRGHHVHWLGQSLSLSRESRRLARILYPPGAVGPLGINWVVQVPGVYRALPRGLQTTIAARALRPAASGWLRARLTDVTITTGRTVIAATPDGEGLHLRLDDRSERRVDHVLLGTGFRVDVARYPFLSPELARAIKQRDGHPALGAGFEGSVPGLHFLGAASAVSFGPLMRFVAGTAYTATALTEKIRCGAAVPATASVVRTEPAS